MICLSRLGISKNMVGSRVLLEKLIRAADHRVQRISSCSLATSHEHARRVERRNDLMARGETRWFLPKEAAVIEALGSFIVPSDEGTPGANEIDVLGASLADTIGSWIACNPEKQLKYS